MLSVTSIVPVHNGKQNSHKNLDVSEDYESNRVIRQRLIRKGILLKMKDSDGKQRGAYTS